MAALAPKENAETQNQKHNTHCVAVKLVEWYIIADRKHTENNTTQDRLAEHKQRKAAQSSAKRRSASSKQKQRRNKTSA
jgi:hypothetical protein